MDSMVSSCAAATAKVDRTAKAERKNLFTGSLQEVGRTKKCNTCTSRQHSVVALTPLIPSMRQLQIPARWSDSWRAMRCSPALHVATMHKHGADLPWQRFDIVFFLTWHR